MRNSRFGQVAMPYPRIPVAYPGLPLMPTTAFIRRTVSVPSQPYQLNISSEQVEEEVYKDLPTEVKVEIKTTGANPEKIVKLESGLEVPSYILKRDIERKTQGIASKPLPEPPPPPPKQPLLHKFGVFASKKPFMASAIALVAGLVSGSFAYDWKHKTK